MSRKRKKIEIRDVSVLEGQYTMDEIEDVIDDIAWEKNVILWVEPENIIGIDYAGEREKILSDPKSGFTLGFDVSRILVGDYCIDNAYQGTRDRIKERLSEILKKAIFVSKNLYSFSPAFDIFQCIELVTKENIYTLLEIAKNAYQEADDCEKIFLAYLYFEFFDAVYCLDYIDPESEKCIGMAFFNKEDQLFFEDMKRIGLIAGSDDSSKLIKNCKHKISTHG